MIVEKTQVMSNDRPSMRAKPHFPLKYRPCKKPFDISPKKGYDDNNIEMVMKRNSTEEPAAKREMDGANILRKAFGTHLGALWQTTA